MLQIHFGAVPDPSLAWVLFLLLAFLLVIIAVGAMVRPGILNGRAPGALPEDNEQDQHRPQK